MASRKTRFTEKDYGYAEFEKAWEKKGEDHVKVGIVSGNNGEYEDGQSVADIAAINEFGTETIPPRPFMRQTMELHGSSIEKFIQKELKKIWDGKQTRKFALARLGEFVKNKMKSTIRNGSFAPNAASTQYAKTSKANRKKGKLKNRPLINTGQLINSIDYEVE